MNYVTTMIGYHVNTDFMGRLSAYERTFHGLSDRINRHIEREVELPDDQSVSSYQSITRPMTRTNFILESRRPNFVNNRTNRNERHQGHHARQLPNPKSHFIVDLSDIGSTTPSATTHNARESVYMDTELNGINRDRRIPLDTTQPQGIQQFQRLAPVTRGKYKGMTWDGSIKHFPH